MPKYEDSVTGSKFVGKEVDTIATHLALPVVDYLALAKKTNPINIEELSGKQDGAMVIGYTSTTNKWYLCTATGNLPVDPWDCVELSTKTTPV